MSWEWSNLIEARFVDGQISVALGPAVWIVAAGLFLIWVLWSRPWERFRRARRVEEITVSFFGMSWRLVRNRETAQLAHEAYVELVTRKAAIPFDEENDLLVEIYESWHALFAETRRLTRRIDADRLASDQGLRDLQELLIAALNEGLRPHLTRWQARFRHFYAAEMESRPELSPQDAQRGYPDYAELVADLRRTNDMLMSLARRSPAFERGGEQRNARVASSRVDGIASAGPTGATPLASARERTPPDRRVRRGPSVYPVGTICERVFC